MLNSKTDLNNLNKAQTKYMYISSRYTVMDPMNFEGMVYVKIHLEKLSLHLQIHEKKNDEDYSNNPPFTDTVLSPLPNTKNEFLST